MTVIFFFKHCLPKVEYLLTYLFGLFVLDNEALIVKCPNGNTTNVDH